MADLGKALFDLWSRLVRAVPRVSLYSEEIDYDPVEVAGRIVRFNPISYRKTYRVEWSLTDG